jgi:hypothetical protein
LTDNAGEGYYFSTASGSVLYNASEFYNREDQLFASFELFMDFLIELAGCECPTVGDAIETERELLSIYAR